MNTRAPILAMKWDKDGDYLAILQEGNCIVPLWSLANRRVIPMDTNLKDPSFLTWSRTGPQLAVGTAKGNLLIYNKSKKQKIPIVGKHSKAITCGDWSCKGNRLILGSDDNNITVSNEVGDTLVQMETKYASLEAKFLPRSDYDKRVNEHDRISCNLDGKALLLNSVSPNTNEDPIELTFGMNNNNECRYGSIVHHYWSDTDTVVIGFSGGHIVVVSTKDSEIGTEKQSSRFHPSGLVKFSYNEQLRRIASAGEDGVRIIDMSDFKEVRAEFTPTVDLENGLVTDLAWSPDGQILTIATSSGNVYNFLAKMSVLNSVYKSSISYLSSLREVSIIDTVRRTRAVEVPLKVEPSLIATGAKHVAAAMNNRVYFHRINSQSNSATTCNEQEYVGTVKGICLNQAYAVVLTDSKATLHPIEPPSSGKSNEVKTFPSREEGAFSKITCVALIDDFLYYGTEAGTVEIFYLNEWTLLSGCELRLNNGIKKIFPNHNGTRVIVVDSTNQIMLFNPIAMNSSASQGVVCIEHTLANIVNVFWDLTDKNVVMFYDGRALHTYVYASVSMKGEFLSMLGPVAVSEDGEIMLTPEKSELPTGNVPLISNSGKITCQVAASGEVNSIVHPYFQDIAPPGSSSMNERVPKNRRGGFPTPRELVSRFCQSLALLKLEDAWQTALELDRRHYWLALSNRAMELLNIDVALRVYRQLGDAGMVMALQQSLQMEDRHALAGNVALLFGDYSRAQELYLASGQPINALNMRKDLLQWDQALKLSQTLAPGQIPEICIRYGQQLEFKDETEKALHMYEMSLNATDNNGNNICPESLSTSAMSGVVRCNLHLGNIKQGIRLANELNEPSLYQEAGDILELHKQYSDAAAMYIKADLYEKAAYVYTKFLLKTDKSRISEAVPILAKVKNDQLNGAFGKACVAAGRYVEAAVAYERANDMDKVVELRLRHLDQTQEAFDLVRKTSSAQAALLVAEYCKEVCDYRGAIEFLLIANKSDEAFKVAQAQGHVETYTQLLGDQITSDDALKVAHFFEKNQDNGKAGK